MPEQGWGGGPAGGDTSDEFILDKLYDVSDPSLNEMLDTLFKALKRTKTSVDSVTSTAGNVIGPASATDGSLAAYNGTTGKIIKDSGTTITSLTNGLLQTSTITVANTGTNWGGGAPSPFTWVAAQGAGTIIVPYCAFISLNQGASGFVGSLGWSGVWAARTGASALNAFTFSSSVNNIQWMVEVGTGLTASTPDIRNSAFQLKCTSGVTGGSATDTIKATLYYTVLAAPAP